MNNYLIIHCNVSNKLQYVVRVVLLPTLTHFLDSSIKCGKYSKPSDIGEMVLPVGDREAAVYLTIRLRCALKGLHVSSRIQFAIVPAG